MDDSSIKDFLENAPVYSKPSGTEPKNDDRLLMLLADLRSALGVGETMMQDELVERAREIRQGFDRYKKVICLTPADFAQLKKISFIGKTKFDTLIDNLNLPN